MEQKILIIDTHGTKIDESTVNLHARNSLIISQYLGADLLSTELADTIRFRLNKYTHVVFVHSSPYVEVQVLCNFLKKQNPVYFYICNDYNLGEPVTLWALNKDCGTRFHMIANHEKETSKCRSKKIILDWHVVNLNALIYKRQKERIKGLFTVPKQPIVYFGTCRTGRIVYFKKYFDRRMVVSTSPKHISKFLKHGITADFIDKLNWDGVRRRLDDFKATLYIEDIATHTGYSMLANRFYEALSHNVAVFFDESCRNTIEKSGYPIDEYFIVKDKEELHEKVKALPDDWVFPEEFHKRAEMERETCLAQLKQIITSY